MTERSKTVSKEIEQALKAVEQAKARLQRAKSKEADRKRKEDTHNKIVWGGIVKKYFPDCVGLNETEMNEVLSVAIASKDYSENKEPECQIWHISKYVADGNRERS